MRLLPLVLLTLAALARPTVLQAQNSNCDHALESQAEVDAFDCAHHPGSIRIEGDDIVDLSGLSELSTVAYSLRIQYTGLTDLDGLDNLSSIGRRLILNTNFTLANIEALGSLETIGYGLYIAYNAISSLNGLENISRASFVVIYENGNLEDIDALSSLAQVSGDVEIYSNRSLTNVDGLRTLNRVGGGFLVSDNASLASLDGIQSLRAVGAFNQDSTTSLIVSGNPRLSDCRSGLGPLLDADRRAPDTISGNIWIWRNEPGGDCNSVSEIVADLQALAIAPNPTAGLTRVSLRFRDETSISLVLLDVLGREVAVLHEGPAHGSETIAFDAGALPAGLYVARLVAGERVETARLTVLR